MPGELPNLHGRVPIVGKQFEIVSAWPTCVIQCQCDAHSVLVLIGVGTPIPCPACGKHFAIASWGSCVVGQIRQPEGVS